MRALFRKRYVGLSVLMLLCHLAFLGRPTLAKNSNVHISYGSKPDAIVLGRSATMGQTEGRTTPAASSRDNGVSYGRPASANSAASSYSQPVTGSSGGYGSFESGNSYPVTTGRSGGSSTSGTNEGSVLPQPSWSADFSLPNNYQTISIFGRPEATEAQAERYLRAINPDLKLQCSAKDLVGYYWQEAGREGVRPDLAFAQALVETGYFRFGGEVQPEQNNFCGLGTVGGGVQGASFATPQLGVRAHIQHLLAYTVSRLPATDIIDPRYDVAHAIRLEDGLCDTWYKLNGKWATANNYAEKIFTVQQRILNFTNAEGRTAADQLEAQTTAQDAKHQRKAQKKHKHVQETPAASEEATQQQRPTMRERLAAWKLQEQQEEARAQAEQRRQRLAWEAKQAQAKKKAAKAQVALSSASSSKTQYRSVQAAASGVTRTAALGSKPEGQTVTELASDQRPVASYRNRRMK